MIPRSILVLAATLLLAGCAIPDLVAHGVKEIEKSNRAAEQSSDFASAQTSQPQARAEDEPPPPSTPAAARRPPMTVEELPAR